MSKSSPRKFKMITIIFFAGILALFVCIVLLKYLNNEAKEELNEDVAAKEEINLYSSDPNKLPRGYTLEKYEIRENTDQSCSADIDCTLPAEYAILSSCPYVSICLNNKCSIVCPQHNGE